jgi:hypothetical protein
VLVKAEEAVLESTLSLLMVFPYMWYQNETPVILGDPEGRAGEVRYDMSPLFAGYDVSRKKYWPEPPYAELGPVAYEVTWPV